MTSNQSNGAMEQAKERVIRYLQDAHAAETGIQDALEGFIRECDDPDVRQVFEEHLVQTMSQARRLEDRLRSLGAAPSTAKGFLNSIMAKASEYLQAGRDEYDRNTQNLIKAYATEHMERAMYQALIGFATAIGDTDTARLAREIQMEEEIAGEILFPLIERYAMGAPIHRNPYTA